MLLLDLLPWGKAVMRGKPIPVFGESNEAVKGSFLRESRTITPDSVTSYGIIFIQNVKTMAEDLLLL